MTPHPPALALALLRRLIADDDPLVGDLLEEFRNGRSASWFWRQVVMAALVRMRAPGRGRHHGPRLAINTRRPQEEAGLLDVPTAASRLKPVGFMNISSVRVDGIGGFGLVCTAVCVALEFDELRASMLVAVLGGVVLGVLMILARRRRGLSPPRRDDPADLLRTELASGRLPTRVDVVPGPHALHSGSVLNAVH